MPKVFSSRLLVGLGFAVPVLALATGCPLLNKATTPTPSPAPTPNFTGQSTDAYTGGVQVFGVPYTGSTMIEFRNPANSASGLRTMPITTDANGFFEVSNTVIPAASGSSQFLWPTTSGSTADATTTNFTDLYVSDPLTNPTVGKNANTPGFTVDTGWRLAPSPALNGTMTASTGATFSFDTLTPQGAPVAAGPFEYQVFLQNSASSSVQWSSAWTAFGTAASGSIAWNGQMGANSDSPSGGAFMAGAAAYKIKWETQGVTDGSKAFGASKWVPVTIQ